MSIDISRHHAVLFDNDGVITNTAHFHFMSFAEAFNIFLKKLQTETGRTYQPFVKDDFRDLVDGKPRYKGALSFLKSRGISLPFGTSDDPPGLETVCQIGNLKAKLYLDMVETDGPKLYEGTVALIKQLHEHGVQTGVVSSSKNCKTILQMAKIDHLFKVHIDGNDMVGLGLRGKPDPDCFLKAAEMLGVLPENAVVIEDAVSGIVSGIAGKFGLVVGVDRGDARDQLLKAGAHIVVEDLSELNVVNLPTTPPTHSKL